MGDLPNSGRTRLSPAGDPIIHRVGLPADTWRDVYYWILVQQWRWFYVLLAAFYLIVNVFFASLYWFQPGCIAENHPGSWMEDFFFSFETLATVGFGVQHPVTLYAHWLVTVEILVGVLFVPLATGLTILKFARPQARVLFSRNLVLTEYDGIPTLMFRAANLRANQIFEARMNLTLLRRETTREGRSMRRLVSLSMVRDTNPMFILTWLVMHRIDEKSPLFGTNWADVQPGEIELLAVMTGLDATTSSTIHARHAYDCADLLHEHMFEDIIAYRPDGSPEIDYRRLHNAAPVR